MSYLKLIKLLYLADREALLRWGRPITTGRYVSMDHGPVVSQIYELIRDEPMQDRGEVWRRYISEPANFEVALTAAAPTEELSAAELELIGEIFAEHGRKSRWELVAFCHTLPEWENPQGGALPTEYRDILNAGRKTPNEIAAIEEELESLAFVDALLSPV
jgi:uncharacterized phage-associated protein